MTDRIPVDLLDPTGGATGQGVVIGTDGRFAIGAVGGAGSAVPTKDDRIGVNLTKQGIVIAKGASGAWDSDLAESPTIIRDPKSGKLTMAYVGYSTIAGVQRAAIGLAYSDDGLTWVKQGTAPILANSGTSGAPDENGCSGPVLLYDETNGVYVVYYIGLTATGYEAGTKSICWATATSLTGPWTRHGAAITTQAGTWRANAVWHASVVQRNGTWFMFFNATNSSGAEVIGYATAPTIQGPWTVDDTNSPLLTGTGSGWDAGNVGDPSVRRAGPDTWVMAYYATNSGTTAACDGLAVTSDHDFPLGWTRYPNNPVLSPGTSYDAKYAHKPFLFVLGGALFHYYTAVDASNVRQIAVATEGLPASTPYALTAKDEGTAIDAAVTSHNFVGSGVTATTDGSGHVTVTIPGATSGAGELLMQDGVTGPPVPLETEDRSDWLYQG